MSKLNGKIRPNPIGALEVPSGIHVIGQLAVLRAPSRTTEDLSGSGQKRLGEPCGLKLEE